MPVMLDLVLGAYTGTDGVLMAQAGALCPRGNAPAHVSDDRRISHAWLLHPVRPVVDLARSGLPSRCRRPADSGHSLQEARCGVSESDG
jgi:hypothetical protein